MAQFPCLPLWTDAWLADTVHLSRLKEGTYWRLLVLMWRTPGCRVPNNDDWLAEHMRMTLDEITTELRPIIAEFCQNDGNWIEQKRLKREFVKRFEFGGRQSVRAKSRWRKKKGAYPNDAAPHSHPSLPLTPKDKKPSLKWIEPASVLGLENSPMSEPIQPKAKQPAQSLASLADGSLAPSPSTGPDQPSKQGAGEKAPSEMTLAEINERARRQGGLVAYRRRS